MSVKDAVVDRFLELCHERNIRINELANLSGVTPSVYWASHVSIDVPCNYFFTLIVPDAE